MLRIGTNRTGDQGKKNAIASSLVSERMKGADIHRQLTAVYGQKSLLQ
jgi:hypothetical protein